MATNKNLFVIGFMGSGKTVSAMSVARRTGAELIDMDAVIVKENEMTINAIFEQFGEAHFRDLESNLLERICQKEGAIVSCGGGIILRQKNVELMKQNGVIVYLQITPEAAYDSVKGSTDRPLLKGNMNIEYITDMMTEREPKYLEAADVVITVDASKRRKVIEELEVIYRTI